MDETTRLMHLAASEHYGLVTTCGTKHDYRSEARADMAAHAVSLKHSDGKVLEAYPCFFCDGWHIGRELAPDERARFTPGGVTGHADGDCKSPVSGSTPDIASRRSSIFERPPGNVYELSDTSENRELLETIEDNRQHPERGRSRPVRDT